MKRLVPILLLIALLCACQKAQTDPTPTGTPAETPVVTPSPSQSPEPTPEPTATPEPTPAFYNPLTGEATQTDISGARPAAVMMNNLKKALPMYGVSTADIIYEAPAEGGITRMLALWQDVSQVPRIGSVRSTRAYYLDLMQGHDAILFHAGGSPEAYSLIESRGLTTLDCVNGGWEGTLYWRDQDRIKNAGFEHSVFTSGARMTWALESMDDTQHAAGYVEPLAFTDDAAPGGGLDALKITLCYSDYKTGVFDYDAESGLYQVSEYAAAYLDGENAKQVCVKNVLVLLTDVSKIPGDTAGRLRITLTGGGKGYYACGGKYVEIKWSKSGPDAPFVYTLSDGTPLKLGRGKSYINIFPKENSATFRNE